MTVPASWGTVGGSVLGASHAARGAPNEDAWAASAPGPVAAVAVADGHGSARCPRAATGAALAVRLAVEVALAQASPAALSGAELARRLREGGAPSLLARWRDAVEADAAARPFTPAELAAVGGGVGPGPATWAAYGCTLICLVATPHLLAALQVGDGDAVAVRDGGGTLRLLADDPASVAGVTSSLAQPDALAALRVGAVELARCPLVAAWASSDGFGGAFDRADWWEQVGSDLAARVAALGLDELAARVPQWLGGPARVGGDDATLALLVPDPLPPASGRAGRQPAGRTGR